MPGRKRGLAVDVLGLVVAVVTLAASAHENTAGIALLDRVADGAQTGTVRTALAGQGFKNAVAAHGATLGIDVQTAGRNPADKGFVPQPRRWVVGWSRPMAPWPCTGAWPAPASIVPPAPDRACTGR